ncbi:MAG: hypothetical protein AB7K37_09290 [Cyclobacteriaceae bacterium]
MHQKTYTIVLLVLLFSCNKTSENQAADPLNFEQLSQVVAERSQLLAGEKVLLVASPGRFDPMIPLLKNEIEKAGATYLGTISVTGEAPAAWATDFTTGATGKVGPELATYFKSVDLGIMLPGATTTHEAYAAMQEVLRQNQGRTIHFHWEGAYDLNGQALAVDSTIDRFYQRVLFETDYQALARVQQAFDSAMRNNWITVTAPAGTDIKFRIGERPVTKQDGDASKSRSQGARNLIDREIELPAGAIRVAPIEETVEGTIAFPDGRWGGEAVTGLKMIFKNGKVEEVLANTGVEAVHREMGEAGVAGESFREFALGFNPLLAIPAEGQRWIPYYGYGAGVVRLSLGDNTELGGNVSGPYVRWNFFTDATVKVGEEIWVENGKLLKP